MPAVCGTQAALYNIADHEHGQSYHTITMESDLLSSESSPRHDSLRNINANTPQYTQLPSEEVRICVAEDNRVNQKVISKFLDRLCYTNMHLYGNGQDALEGIRQQAAHGEPYHIVLMDISMPVMGGLTAAKLIRQDANELVCNVPIIAMHPQFERCVPDGMNDVLQKPIRRHELAGILETYGNPLRLVEPEACEAASEPEVKEKEVLSVRPRL